MARKRYTAEQIIKHLREAEIFIAKPRSSSPRTNPSARSAA